MLRFGSITGVHSAIQLPHDTVQCLDQTVEYQCTVSGSAMTWSAFRDGIWVVTYTSTTSPGGTITIGLFTVELLSVTPLVSNISFTVQSSIDGYTIVCEDANTMNNITILINIAGKNYSKLVHYGN